MEHLMRQELATLAKRELAAASLHNGSTTEVIATLMVRIKCDKELMNHLLKDACRQAIEQERQRTTAQAA
jgi:hypothetical protein